MEENCWLYAGSISGDYGVIYEYVSGKTRRYRAHRVMYENLVGEIPEGLVLDHLCRVKPCINPSHLEPVTNQENVLRGIGPTARNKLKTHCPQGHEYSESNTRWRIDSRWRTKYRACRICYNALMRRYRSK